MATIVALALATGLAALGYAYQRGRAPDPERVAGQVWADVSHDAFETCPRENGIKFWMGCTDKAPIQGSRK